MPSLSRSGQTLTLRTSREPAPELPTTAAKKTIWRDGDGVVVAFGGAAHPKGWWLTVPGVGSFTFDDHARPVVAYPDDAVPDDLIADTFRRTVLPLALQALGSEVLHASAVSTPRGVAALCAVSGTGKSTLAYALSRRGLELWADDAVQFQIVVGDGVDAVPLPFTLRLKEPSNDFFGRPDAAVVVEPAPAPLAAVFVLERGPSLRLERLRSADAFSAVLTHGYYFDLDDAERKRRMMDAYLRLVTLTPVFSVTVPEGLEHVDAVAKVIHEACE